ncbi:hypothetical protein AAG570_005455 [Ranatra chinensis]|uniref:C2H2-type domain-containing protein n=1 Tax=Ranatra chinensis TaxID=642074 RepID=A0ABD0Y026_9HEMI
MFECDICQMKFSNGANMRRHKMRHTGVKPYECRVCQKRFFRKDHLAEHFTTHTKTLPFHCPICNRGFQRQIAMRAHFQNEHVGQNDVVKSCPLCSYRAGSMKSLRVHFFNRHGIDLDRPTVVTDSTVDNATPPMHFLTPHVEISMADPPPPSYSPTRAVSGDSPGSPQSGDSNTPSSSGQPVHHVHSPAKFRLNCVFCGIGFPDQTLYFLHKGCHSESNPWKCNICGEQCCNVYDFNSHLLSKTHQ